jgi:multiple sugar transport system permease protein
MSLVGLQTRLGDGYHHPVQCLEYMGYYMIIYLAGLQGINPELYEAANLDGTKRLAAIRYVTVPQLSATTFFILVMLTIQCFKVYDIVYMVTQAGPGTATLVWSTISTTRLYKLESWLRQCSGHGVFALVLAVTLIQFKTEQRMR